MTVYGVVDAALAFGRGSVADRTQLLNSAGPSASRLGFRGREDLGSANYAGFTLEAGLNNDNGTGAATNTNNQVTGGSTAPSGTQGLTFNRDSFVSFGGRWGELRFGREGSPQFWNLNDFDPFQTNGVGANQMLGAIAPTLPTAVRISNSLGYRTVAGAQGFYAQANAWLGENAHTGEGTQSDGNGAGLRLGYMSGPLNVSGAISTTKYAARTAHQNNLGAWYDIGAWRLSAVLSKDQLIIGDGRGYLVGASTTRGPHLFNASYSAYRTKLLAGGEPQVGKFAIGYMYNLSKRTGIYTTYANARNRGGASEALNGAVTDANSMSSGLDLGLTTMF